MTMLRALVLSAATMLAATPFAATGADAPPTAKISREDVKAHFRVLEKMDPKQGNLWEKLVFYAGDKREYSPDDVQAVTGPPKKFTTTYEAPKPRSDERPFGGLTREEVERSLRVSDELTAGKTHQEIVRDLREQFASKSKDDVILALADTKPVKYDSVETLHSRYGTNSWYTASELRDVRANPNPKGKKSETIPQGKHSKDYKPDDSIWGQMWRPIVQGIVHFKIRQSWSDVLLTEDRTAPADAVTAKKTDDLVGATFSWANDFKANAETWTAVGAIIAPMDWRFPVNLDGFNLDHFTLAPSVTINRVVTNGKPKGEVDEMYYRLGMFLDWVDPVGGVQLRGALVYGTDTGQHAELPAFEADLEPRFLWAGVVNHPIDPYAAPKSFGEFAVRYLNIGYQNILIPKKSLIAGEADNSLFDYQLRTYLHVEGGDLQRAGSHWNVTEGSFLRLGPSAQLRVNWPELVLGKDLSFTGQYTYLPAIRGTDKHQSLVKLDVTLTLLKDSDRHQKLTINADYTKGGLDFTKQNVDVFTLGLGVLY